MSRTTRALGAVVLVGASLLGCSEGDGATPEATDPVEVTAASTTPSTETTPAATTTSVPEAPPFGIATYNTGLAEGFVPLTGERLPLVAEALAELDADVVFLQEVWTPEAVAAIRDATSATFPEAVFPEPIPDTDAAEPACTVEQLSDLVACIEANCADASPDELVACVLENCGAQFSALDEECQSCVAANVGQTVEDAVASCTAGSSSFAYGGSVGLGLLSRVPILETDVVVLDSSLNRRAVLHAVLDAGERGRIDVFGTHLSAVFSDVPFPGDGTWEAEQAAQIGQLVEYIDTRVEPTAPIVLLGDFNTGPAGALFTAEVPANYELLVGGVDTNTYIEPDGARCTFCGDNPLIDGGDGGVVIDHVFTRGVGATEEASRILDEPVMIVVDGADRTTALSDHYGVLLELTGPFGD